MGELKIAKDVPPPERHPLRRFPWHKMGHGDSILVPWSESDVRRRAKHRGTSSAHVAALRWIKRNRPGWKVVTRTEGEATRIWLVDPTNNGDHR